MDEKKTKGNGHKPRATRRLRATDTRKPGISSDASPVPEARGMAWLATIKLFAAASRPLLRESPAILIPDNSPPLPCLLHRRLPFLLQRILPARSRPGLP